MRGKLVICSTLGAWSALFVLLGTVAPAAAQTAPLQSHDVAMSVDSGVVENTGQEPTVVFSTVIDVGGATWLRLKFDAVRLGGDVLNGTESYLLITSLLDGAQQYLNTVHVRQWRHTSAYFNGDAVLIELVAHPGTGPNQLTLSEVIAGEHVAGGPDTICGPTDDRVLSYDDRAARLLPIGCTTWLIDDCSHCFLTAGHCSGGASVVEFNVPLSSSNGSINHPGPEDQYSVDLSSVQSNGGQGIGDDWAYFGCLPNSNTGLTPYEAQGDCFSIAMPPPAANQDTRITGYGTVSSPISPTWNQVQKTHVGPLVTSSGSLLQYRTDTTGGNSGSPVILEETSNSIGIHTHGGCTYSGGQNSGTGVNHSGLQNALANPQGVCVCQVGLRVTPITGLVSTGDPGGPFTPSSIDYTLENLETTGFDYLVTNNEPWVSLTNASGYLAGGATTTVTVSINSGANSLPVGQFTDVVEFVNLTTHEGDTTRDVTLVVGGPDRIYFWDMDSNPGWSTQGQWAWGQPTGGGGEYGGPDPTSGYTGSNVYGYNLNGDYPNNMPEYHLTTTALDCSELEGVTLRFQRWLGVEQPIYDHAHVRVSSNGSNWVTVWENNQEITDYSWVPQELNLSAYADGQSTVYLRWTMGTTDGGWRYCGWNIDDVEIWAFASLLGDLNCDGVLNAFDIDPFVLALTNPAGYAAAWPNCDRMLADVNGDGIVNAFDIDPFVELLAGG